MGYKTTGNSRSKTNSAASSSTVVFNNPTGEGLGMNGQHIASGDVLKSSPILAGATEASNTTSTTIGSVANNMTITSLVVCDASYNNLDDTAINTAGGFIKLIGTNFMKAAKVYIGGVLQTGVTFVSSTELRVVVPAAQAATYSVMVFNGTSGAIWGTGLKFSGFPTFTQTTYSQQNTTVSVQLLATGDAPLTFSIFAGTLPSGLSMSSSGLITGTPLASSSTLLTILCNDVDLQTTQQDITLTIAIGDTSFNNISALTHGDSDNGATNNVFVDSSTVSPVVTTSGVPSQSTFTPYGAYWSTLFNASDYMATTYNGGAYQFGTGDFTIETWINVNDIADNRVIIDTRTSGITPMIQIVVTNSGTIQVYNGATVLALTTLAVVPGTWYHIAFTRASNSTRLFVNGVQAATTFTDATNFNNTTTGVVIGRNGAANANFFYGFMSNLRIVKGTALYTTTFTPPTSPLTAITGTSLLTCNSNMLVDKSTTGAVFTFAGVPGAKRFNPFGIGAGAYTTNADQFTGSTAFNGSTDYIQSVASNAAYSFGTGDFTVEGWVRFNVVPGSGIAPICQSDGIGGSTNDKWWFGYTAGTLTFATHSSGGFSAAIPWTPTTGTWYHVSATRISGVMKLFVNGVLGTATIGGTPSGYSLSSNGFTIGAMSTPYFFNGQISNIRWIKGTGIYSASFKPPVATLTAVSGTSLLTCQSSRSVIVENSSNNFAMNKTGTPVATGIRPYGSASYFTGSANYATFPNSANLAFGTGDFTIEFWMKAATQDTSVIVSSRAAIGGSMLITTGGSGSSGASGTLRYSPTNTNSTVLVADGNWHHCAITRASGTVTLWVDGVSSATTTDTTNYSGTTGTWYIGTNDISTPINLLTGSLSNLRVVKGTAIYTAAFTPSTSPLTSVSGTGMLLFQNGLTPTIDYTSGSTTVATITGTIQRTVKDQFHSTGSAQTTYGGSMFFNGSTDNVIVPDTAGTMISGTAWTAECWIYPTVNQSGVIFTKRDVNTNFGALMLVYNSNNTITMAQSSNGTSYDLVQTATIGTAYLNQWSHVAVTRSGSNCSVFINGVRTYNFAPVAGNASTVQTFRVGSDNAGNSSPYAGYISGLRIVNGTAIYSPAATTIPVPTAPIQQVPSTTLLLEGMNGSAVDTSFNGALIMNGAATTTASSKKFGSTAYNFTGASGYISQSADQAQNWNVIGNLTWEAWVYIPTLAGTGASYPLMGQSQAGNDSQTCLYVYGNGKIAIGIIGVNEIVTATGVFPAATWTHVALVRTYNQSGNSYTTTIFINGVSQVSGGGGVWQSSVRPLWFGAGAGLFLNGQMDDIRISKTARYLANFTPPTNPFPDQ